MNERTVSILDELKEASGRLVDVLVTSWLGMLVTGKYFLSPKEIITVRYPRKKLNVPANFRGRLRNDPERCISCELCKRACPTDCIVLHHEMGADKKRILTDYSLDMTICLYCGLCTEACPDSTKNAEGVKCLAFVSDYEYSSEFKEKLGYYYRISDDQLAAKRRDAADRAAKAAEAAQKAAAAKAAAAAATPAPAPAAPNPSAAPKPAGGAAQ